MKLDSAYGFLVVTYMVVYFATYYNNTVDMVVNVNACKP